MICVSRMESNIPRNLPELQKTMSSQQLQKGFTAYLNILFLIFEKNLPSLSIQCQIPDNIFEKKKLVQFGENLIEKECKPTRSCFNVTYFRCNNIIFCLSAICSIAFKICNYCSVEISVIRLVDECNLILYWTPGLGQKGPMKQGPSVLPSVRKLSQNWLISFFLKLNMVLGAHIQLRVTEPDNPHRAKMAKNRIWTFQENHVISFVWNLCKTKVLMVH